MLLSALEKRPLVDVLNDIGATTSDINMDFRGEAEINVLKSGKEVDVIFSVKEGPLSGLHSFAGDDVKIATHENKMLLFLGDEYFLKIPHLSICGKLFRGDHTFISLCGLNIFRVDGDKAIRQKIVKTLTLEDAG